MKKSIITSLVLLSLGTLTKAQSSVELNVRLNPIQTLVINNSQEVVNLDYSTKDDYANGVTSINLDHLNIYSTGGFQIKVRSSSPSMQNGTKSINTNTIQIKSLEGSNGADGAVYSSNVQLNNNETTIVSSQKGGVDKTVTIEYIGAGLDTYIDNYIANQDPTVYKTDVIYTIISQ